MKKLLLLLSIFTAGIAFGQTTITPVPVGTQTECKAAEPTVIEAANFIVSKPIDNEAARKLDPFIWGWAQNTEHSLLIAGPITKLSSDKSNTALLWIFIACQAKYILENPDKAKNEDEVLVAAYIMLADYVSKTENNVTITKRVQKLIDAKKNNTIREYVKEK